MTTTAADNTTVAPCPPLLLGIRSALGPQLLTQILQSKILLVGSGGIGCELLKNLALSGFRNIDVIDLDTIDVSNLNRQFLFRSQHVGLPKCVVASEAALKMVPPLSQQQHEDDTGAKYTPYHGNVCDNSKFNVPYVQRFNLVLNALDNIAARRRVNRLCLAANVPLVEAGTAGYLGQVTVIDKNSNTECYECQPKPTQKVYPICTIRSTPSQPVHCIVWAKELYKLCFGPKVGDSMLFEDEESLRAEKAAEEEEKKEEEGGANGNESKNGSAAEAASTDGEEGGEKSTYMDLIVGLRLLLGVDNVDENDDEKKALDLEDEAKRNDLLSKAQESLTALFVTEIQKQIGMDRYKTAEKVPVPVSLDDLAKCTATITGEGEDHLLPPTERKDYKPTQIWSPSDCIQELASCFLDVAASNNQPLPEFDKDDDMAMRFVTAASNLRSYVFQIEPIQSLYSAKGIAGNIIPAIATTNAIVAGLQVLQCFHILKAQMNSSIKCHGNGDDGAVDKTSNLKKTCRYTYCLRDKTRKGYYLQPTTLPDPDPNCFVCRNAIISLALNTQEWTLDMLLSRVIKKELGFHEPTILVGGDIVYEEGEDIDPSEYAINLKKTLANLPSGGVSHGSVIRIEDYSQDLEVDVNVSHKERWMIKTDDDSGAEKVDDREGIEKFEIGGKKPVASAATADSSDGGKDDIAQDPASTAAEDDDDDIEIIDDDESTKNTAAASSNGKKRKPDTEEDGSKAKKTKVDTDEVIEIE
jgi:ubiquitin-like 1-activating enzyme E1 B